MKEKILTWAFILYVVVLAIGTVDQVFLDNMIFPPALDRQILKQVDILRERPVRDVDQARAAAGRARENLAAIRLEAAPSALEARLDHYAQDGGALDEGTRLLDEARTQAVQNFVDNDEFSLKICIRALDPDFVMKIHVWGLSGDDVKVRKGCLEALKKISGKADGFGYDPAASEVSRRDAIQKWWDWYSRFMDERRRPAPASMGAVQQQPPPMPGPLGPDGKPLPAGALPPSTPEKAPEPAPEAK